MLVWLDNATNKVGKPNENYARELMELFTLGIGNYTQQDVTELARALTGWTVANYNRATNYDQATFLDRASDHDGGSKTILGQTGNWDGYDAIGILVNRTDAAGSVPGRFLGAQALVVLRRVRGRAATWSTSSAAGVHGVGPFDPRDGARDPPARGALRAGGDQGLGAQPGRVRGRRGADARGLERLFGAGQRAGRHGSGALQSVRRQGLGLGHVVGEHRVPLRARRARQHARIQPRRDAARASIRTRCSPGQDASSAGEVVDLLAARLNVADAPDGLRAAWIDYMNRNDDGSLGTWTNTPGNVDEKVRGLVHVMLTCPDFQLA